MSNNSNATGNQVVSSDFLSVLLALKQNVMKDLSVAECVVITEANDSKREYRGTLLTNTAHTIVCTSLQNLSVKKGDVVLTIFTNTDFRVNLSRLKNNQLVQSVATKNYHSNNYGIIVGIIYSKEN